MGLLTKLKSLLGFEDDSSGVRRTESGVTIEREPDESPEPDAETESAVKGVSTESADADEADYRGPAAVKEETEATGTDDGAETDTTEDSAETGVSTEDVTTAPEGIEQVETGQDDAAEPSEAVEPSTDAAEPAQTAGDEPEPTPEDASGESAAGAGEAEAGEEATEADEDTAEADAAAGEPVGEGEPLEDVKGIGPAYAERLRDAGVADVTELAKADADLLAEETGLSAKRISTWIDRAQAR